MFPERPRGPQWLDITALGLRPRVKGYSGAGWTRKASERERGGRVKVKERQTVKREPDYNLSARGNTNPCAHSSSAREDEISVSLGGHQNF